MRRITVALLVCMCAALVWPGSATGVTSTQYQVSGSNLVVVASVPGGPVTAECQLPWGTSDYIFSGTIAPFGASTIDVTTCLWRWGLLPLHLVLTAPDGTVTATATAYAPHDPDAPYTFYWATVTGGTGRYAGATGELTIGQAMWPSLNGTSGTFGHITFGKPSPTATNDCKGGGWRDLVDASGQPFKNQGQCVASVVRT